MERPANTLKLLTARAEKAELERDTFKAALLLITQLTWDMEYYAPGDSPGATMLRIAKLALYGPYECTCEATTSEKPCEFCRNKKREGK